MEPLRILHIEGRRSLRVIWACEELGVPYELSYERGSVEGSLARLRERRPLMPITPTVRFGEDWIVESGAILEVLQARHGDGRLAPAPGSADYPVHLQWLHFAEGTAAARFFAFRMAAEGAGRTPDEMPQGYHQGNRTGVGIEMVGPHGVFDYIEDHLSRRPFFGGQEFSIADIMMYWPIRIAKLTNWIDSADYTSISAWRQTVEARPAFARATAASTPDGADEFGLPAGIPDPAVDRWAKQPAS